MSKRAPRYMLPINSCATKNSITDEEFRQRRGNPNEGRSCNRLAPTSAGGSRKLTFEEKSRIIAAKRKLLESQTLPLRDDQNNREHQHAKSTLKVPYNDWNSYLRDTINRENPYKSSSLKSPGDNVKYTPSEGYYGRHQHSNSPWESPGDNCNPSHSDHYNREYQHTGYLLESPRDSGRYNPSYQNDVERQYTSSSLELPVENRRYIPSDGYNGRHRHSKSSWESPGDNWNPSHSDHYDREYLYRSSLLELSDDDDLDILEPPCPHQTSLQDDNLRLPYPTKTRSRSLSYDAKDNAKNQEKNPMNLHSKTKPRRSVSAPPINTSNDSKLQDNDDSATTSASLLHKNQRSSSSANKDLRISETSLQDDNFRSPLQTKTDFRRSLSYDAKDKGKNQEKNPMNLHSQTKPRRSKLCDNLLFYQGKIKSKPAPGYTIETILERFCDDDFLEKNYPYCIKWLFPIPNKSLDRNTQELLPHEIKALQKDKEIASRVFKAFVLVLDYYGIIMVNTETGELMKSRNWKSRWTIMNTNNELEFKHITRVLVSLGALGYERYQVPLIEIFIKNKDDIKEFDWNSIRHWIDNVNDEEQQNALFEKYGEQIFSLETLEAYDTQTKHEQQHFGFDNTLEHLGTIGS